MITKNRLKSRLPAPRPLAVLSRTGIPGAAQVAWESGRAIFPIDPSLPEATIRALLAQAGSDEIITSIRPDRPLRLTLPDEAIALLIATSGSSGTPKAVMLSAGALRAAANASSHRLPLGENDSWLGCLPLFHIGGFSILSRCGLAGATAVLLESFDPHEVAAKLPGITHLSLVPTMLSLLLDATSDAPPPASLRHVLVGGAALAADLAERARAAGWPIRPTYGMSETASQFATLTDVPRPWPAGLVGPPLPGGEAALTEDGRLKVRGPMLMAGYANPDLRSGDGLEEGWFVTGDLARISPAGELTILGRADDVIISGGKKILPAMVEDQLRRCPGIDAVAVLGRPDPLWGQVVVAVFSGQAEPDQVVGWCRDALPSSLRPRAAVRVAALPLLSNGKPDRSALIRLAAEAGAGGEE